MWFKLDTIHYILSLYYLSLILSLSLSLSLSIGIPLPSIWRFVCGHHRYYHHYFLTQWKILQPPLCLIRSRAIKYEKVRAKEREREREKKMNGQQCWSVGDYKQTNTHKHIHYPIWCPLPACLHDWSFCYCFHANEL